MTKAQSLALLGLSVLVSTIWALVSRADMLYKHWTQGRVSSWYGDHRCVSQHPSCKLFWGSFYLQVPCLAWLASKSYLPWPVVTELGFGLFAALFMVSPGSPYLLCSLYVLAFGLYLSLCNMWWWGHWIPAPRWFSCWANGQKKALGVGEGRAEYGKKRLNHSHDCLLEYKIN